MTLSCFPMPPDTTTLLCIHLPFTYTITCIPSGILEIAPHESVSLLLLCWCGNDSQEKDDVTGRRGVVRESRRSCSFSATNKRRRCPFDHQFASLRGITRPYHHFVGQTSSSKTTNICRIHDTLHVKEDDCFFRKSDFIRISFSFSISRVSYLELPQQAEARHNEDSTSCTDQQISP